MIATSTHDTKRSEDARARLHALSELPDEWEQALAVFARENAALKRELDGRPAPSRNDEYFVYQTLLAVWPLDGALGALGERLEAYLTKALREAGVSSSWLDPNPDYENATIEFARALIDPGRSARFLAAFERLEQRTARAGMLSSLSRCVLKATCPGVPDYYQGSERWDLSLVDPDNRRPIDWQLHARELAELGSADLSELVERWRDGKIKLFVTRQTLDLRRRKPQLFAGGSYVPVEVVGSARDRVIAFLRQRDEEAALVVVGRFFAGREPGWGDTRLTLPPAALPGSYRELLSGRDYSLSTGALPVAELFRALPCAVLERMP